MSQHHKHALNRRQFLKSTALLAGAGSIPGLSWASTGISGNNKLAVIILRGAMDGLSAVIPYGDPLLASYRGALIPEDSSLLKLDNYFALHPAFAESFKLQQAGELGIVHAVASAYRERSHFDGQNVLESGLSIAMPNPSGWLNRALQLQTGQQAMALGQAVPLILRGEASAGSWAPATLPPVNDDTLSRLQKLYDMDSFLGPRLMEALNAREIVGTGMDRSNSGFSALIDAAASFLNAPGGPNIVVLENDGWDTHANQGTEQGTLPRKFAELDTSLAQLKQGLGSTWQNTVVVVMTEFGRTVRVNGSLGTDHGTASVAFLAGGNVSKFTSGSAVTGPWPGLGESSLRDGRDLQPTNDLRQLLAEVLQSHMAYDAQLLREVVFPGLSTTGFQKG
ncbi:MAG TPA: Tat pathway signal protein [Pseudohongiella sp.]|nr:Tat pathway signal protein [Pseudohongiella sp.]HBX37197.1 Tat pathway signal protein [Pseudohongiella sp.]|tara:strand:+ start:268746 stop:269927 length:1182 start_codon:yes stop_codon:yes gene_type:complete